MQTARKARAAGVIAFGGVALFVGIVARFIVLPPHDAVPERADVVFVLGRVKRERMRTALELVRQGVVADVLISIPAAARTTGSTDERLLRDWIAQVGVPTYCEYAEPHTTQGEAQMLQRHAQQHGWTSAIVITQTAHLERARAIIARSFGGAITMQASGEAPHRGWLFQVAYQSAGTVKAWLLPALHEVRKRRSAHSS